MAKKALDICAYCSTPTWCETRANGKPQCGACKVERFFSEVLYQPIGLKLLGWQRKALRDLYGTVGDDDGLRRYRRAYLSLAKKNGKSFLVGGLPIYHLIADGEPRAEAYGAAAAKDQAGIVFRAAAQFVNANPDLKEVLRVVESTRRIYRRDGAGFYSVISADGDIQDGIEPSLALIDELHRWKTKKAETLYDVLIKGMISRREPLTVQITTAGEIYDSPICYAEHEFAQQVLRGSLKSDRFYPAIWAADAERVKTDPEYWKSREFRVAANPSHEDLGGFLRDEALVEELEKAIAKPAEKPKYLRYHGNLWVESETRAIDMAKWAECGGELRTLVDRPCYGGLDLSTSIDLTAFVLLFPDDDGTFDVLPFFWMPKENVARREQRDRVPYSLWIEQELIEATEGNEIDYAVVRKRIKWAKECFNLREVDYDPCQATETVQKLNGEEGIPCVPIKQGFPQSAATKRLIELVTAVRLRHGNNPVLRWNMDCLAVKSDGNDRIRPVKPERNTSTKRIDGAVALINAIDRQMASQSGPSVYETRGIVTI